MFWPVWIIQIAQKVWYKIAAKIEINIFKPAIAAMYIPHSLVRFGA